LARVPVWLFGVAVLSGTVALWAALQHAVPYLGHDEAVYATKARSWLADLPANQWQSYRPVLLPALGRVALAIHDGVGSLRLLGLGLALATLGIIYFAGARLTSPRRAVVAMAVFVSGWGFLRRLPEFLNDIAAASLLLAVAYLIVRSRQRPASPALLAASAIAVVVFYLRYGAASGLLALAGAMLVAWGPRAWLASWRQLGVAAGLFLGGLLPHFVHSDRVGGSPLAILRSAGEVAYREYMGDGLFYYAQVFPFRLAGDLGGVVMAAGLIAAVLAARRLLRGEPERPADDRVRVFLGLAAVLHVIVLGLTAHGEERFVFFPIILLTILGIDGLAEFFGKWSAAALVVVALFAALAALANYRVVTDGYLAQVTAERASIVAVAQQLSTDRPCLVVTSYQPEIGWYSGCATMGFAQAKRVRLPANQPVYLAIFEGGRGQPSDPKLRQLVADRAVETMVVPTAGSLGRARILHLPHGQLSGRGVRARPG
jgi:hypothetical protein